MEKDELFELVVMLTVKNMDLEKEIKRLNKQTDRLWEDLKEYQKDQDEEFDFDYDENNYSSAREEARDLLEGIEEQDYEANCLHEKDVELIQKINAINSRLGGTNSRLAELEYRVTELEEKEEYNGK